MGKYEVVAKLFLPQIPLFPPLPFPYIPPLFPSPLPIFEAGEKEETGLGWADGQYLMDREKDK